MLLKCLHALAKLCTGVFYSIADWYTRKLNSPLGDLILTKLSTECLECC